MTFAQVLTFDFTLLAIPLHLNLLQVIRHYDSSLEVLCGFPCVVLLAGGYCLLFRVIEDEVLYVEFCCELSCVKSRAVVFLVRLEGVAVSVEAESLTHHPVGMSDVLAVERVVRLVAQAGKDSSVRQFGTEAVLLLLRGMDVEAGEADVAHVEALAVRQLMEDDALLHLCQLLLGENHVDDGAYDANHLVVAIDVQLALVALTLRHHADDPDDAQHVVGVGVGDEEMMNVGYLDVRLAKLRENAVAATRIDEE